MMQRLLLFLASALSAAMLASCGTDPEGPPDEPPSPQECSSGQSRCSGVCRDLQSDVANCGACGNACAAGQSCQQGQCRTAPLPCSAGQTVCGGACVDLQSSASHCGGCGNLCASGSCAAGECAPVAACRDGRITGSEACDDANERTGDGCGASCAVEAGWQCQGEPSRCHLLEVEPNNSAMAAQAVPLLPSLRVRGAITPGTDADVFRFTLSGVADLRFDTFDGTYNGSGPETCNGGIDTELELIGPDGAVLALDDDGGVGFCSSIESEGRRLAPGTYSVRVTSHGGDSISAYTLRLQLHALCGDGTLQLPEQCDDGNTTSGDRCSASCRAEKVPETESNDTAATAQALSSVPAFLSGSITPGTDKDMFRFTLPTTTDLRIDTLDGAYTGEGTQTCEEIDTLLELIAADGSTVLDSDDDGGLNSCASLDSAYDTAVRRLPPGTYFARVTSYDDAVLPAYSLTIGYVAICGDGAVTGSEECDGSPGCTATCERVPVCGDGHLDFPEACEDGNTVDTDECSRTCKLSGAQDEVEPNDTRSEADARAGGAQPVLISGTQRFSGAFSTRADKDVYKMQLQSAQVVRVELFRGGLGQCASGSDPVLRVVNTAGEVIGYDDDGGIERCSVLVLSLQPGSYYITVERLDTFQPEPYLLEVSFQRDAGAEAEVNNTLASANQLSGADSFILGAIPTATDVDYFRITVPVGKDLRAEVIEGGAKRCEQGQMEPELVLLDASGSELDSYYYGRGSCARIDGTGEFPTHSGASDLPAGTYYLRVRPAPNPSAGTDTFEYRLSVTLR